MTTLSIESIERDSTRGWPAPCTVTRRGPLTTIALEGDVGVEDIAGLDRAAALAIDLPGLEVLVIDVCELEDPGTKLGPWLLRVETRAGRAGVSVIALAEPGRIFDELRTLEATSHLRVLRGSAAIA